MNSEQIEIRSFYEFKDLSAKDLESVKTSLKQAMLDLNVRGTILLANEGYNGMVCGASDQLDEFLSSVEKLLDTNIVFKSSFAESAPFRKTDVRVKKEIVTLKKEVDISLGENTHVDPAKWNDVIADPDVLLLDTRNQYEYETGSFRGAVNPGIVKFSDLPEYVAQNLDPHKHKRVAMFCTGGIRCEKFAPYMKQLGFEEVFQLEGGILKYLEVIPAEESLWEGECFVFDERVSVNSDLKKGELPDMSQRRANKKDPQLKGNQ